MQITKDYKNMKRKSKAFPKCVSLLEITPERSVPSFLRIRIITIDWLVPRISHGPQTFSNLSYIFSVSHSVMSNSLWPHGPSGSSVHAILQARVLGWVAISFSRGSFQPRHWTQVSHIAGRFFTIWATREPHIFLKSICLIYLFGCTWSLLWHVTPSFLNGDWTWAPCTESRVLATEAPGKSLVISHNKSVSH